MTTPYPNRLLSIGQLAEMIGISVATLRRRVVERPNDYPRPRAVPGMKNFFFLLSDVVAWIDALPLAETSKKEDAE